MNPATGPEAGAHTAAAFDTAKPGPSPALTLVVLLVAASIVVLAVLAASGELARNRERSVAATRNTAMLIDQVVQGLFARIDSSLRNAARVHASQVGRSRGDEQGVEAFLSDQHRQHPEIVGLRITDERGKVVHGRGGGDSQPAALSDEPFFVQARANTASGLIVTGPERVQATGKWVLVLARRLEDERGRFAGAISADIAVEGFVPALTAVDLGPNGSAALRSDDLALIYRTLAAGNAIGTRNVSAELAGLLKSGRREGSFEATAPQDGVTRVGAYRRIGNYPMYVIVGAASQDHYSDIASDIAWIVAWALAALVIGAAGALAVRRTTLRLHAELAERSALEHSLDKIRRDLARAQEIARVGNWVLDPRTGRSVWSDQLYTLFQLDRTSEPPAFESMAQYFTTGSWRRLRAAIETCVTRGTPYAVDCRVVLGNGRCTWINAKGVAVRGAEGRIVEVHGTAQEIGQRKQLELALARANRELDDLHNGVPCGVFSLDQAGHYLRINATMLSWIGYAREDVIGQRGPRDSLTTAGQALFDRSFPEFLRTGSVRDLEVELRDRSGRSRLVSVSASAIRDAEGRFVMGRSVMFDVTELRRTQQRIMEISRAQDSILMNQMVGAVKLRERRATWVNPALGRIFGYTPAELIDQNARILYLDDASYEAVGRAAYPLLALGSTYRHQVRMRHKDGHALWIDMQGVMLDTATGESLWMLADVTELHQQKEQLEFHALHDALTGLANRAQLHQLLPRVLAASRRVGDFVALCYLDLDGFKPINDRHGHGTGDEVLRHVAQRLQKCVRPADVVARMGGDEFVLVLGGLDTAEGYQSVCTRVRAALGAPIQVDGTMVSVGAAMGVAVFPTDGEDADALLALADQRMYGDKAARR